MKLKSALFTSLLLSSTINLAEGRIQGTRLNDSILEHTNHTTLVGHRLLQTKPPSSSSSPILSVCDNAAGIFQPDFTKYYTIIAPDGRVWAHDEEAGKFPFNRGNDLKLTEDGAAASSQWRFERNNLFPDSDKTFVLKNRLSGLAVALDAFNRGFSEVEKIFFFSTQGAPKKNKDNLGLSVSCNADQTGLHIDNVEITIAKKISETKCLKRSTTCASHFRDPTVETLSQRRSNCVGTRRKKCLERTTLKPEQGWIVKEVTEFVPLAAPNLRPDTISIINPPEGPSLGAGVAFVNLAIGGVGILCPACGALLLLASALGFEALTDDPTELLNQLADQIVDVTNSIVATALAFEGIREAGDVLGTLRTDFLEKYPRKKKAAIENGHVDVIEAEGGNLLLLADRYEVEVARYFGNDFTVSELNGKRAFLGFDLYTYTIAEILAIRQEGLLMLSLVKDDSCADLVDLHILDSETAKLQNRLIDMREMMIEFRKDEFSTSRKLEQPNPSKQDFQARVKALDGNKKVFEDVITSGIFGIVDLQLQLNVKRSIEDEVEFDMRNLSHSISNLLELLDGFAALTENMCEAIRTDRVIRTRFLQDSFDAEPVECTLPETTARGNVCFADIDCCSESCDTDTNTCL